MEKCSDVLVAGGNANEVQVVVSAGPQLGGSE